MQPDTQKRRLWIWESVFKRNRQISTTKSERNASKILYFCCLSWQSSQKLSQSSKIVVVSISAIIFCPYPDPDRSTQICVRSTQIRIRSGQYRKRFSGGPVLCPFCKVILCPLASIRKLMFSVSPISLNPNLCRSGPGLARLGAVQKLEEDCPDLGENWSLNVGVCLVFLFKWFGQVLQLHNLVPMVIQNVISFTNIFLLLKSLSHSISFSPQLWSQRSRHL